MMADRMSRSVLGILGAGRAGTAMARLALKAGYHVVISNSRGPESLSLMVEVLVPGAVAATSEGAAAGSDIAILALPLSRYRMVPAEPLAGKIVIDAMNYWAIGAGRTAELEGARDASSETIQAFLPDSRVVKTLNHIGYHELEEGAAPQGTPGRLAIGLAGDDEDAKRIVASLINDMGFDSLDVGLLSEGWRLGPSSPAFGGRFTLEELRTAVRQAGPPPQPREP
jgi:predicted dinucleotide-binding enzyme